jgi:hypothetical protein
MRVGARAGGATGVREVDARAGVAIGVKEAKEALSGRCDSG